MKWNKNTNIQDFFNWTIMKKKRKSIWENKLRYKKYKNKLSRKSKKRLKYNRK